MLNVLKLAFWGSVCMADLLVDVAANNRLFLFFMDSHSGCNQIYIVHEDTKQLDIWDQ